MKRSIVAILVLLSLLAVAIIAAPTTTAQEPAPFYWEFTTVLTAAEQRLIITLR